MSRLGGDLPLPTNTGHAYGPQRIIQIVKEQPTDALFPVRSKRSILLYIRLFVKPRITVNWHNWAECRERRRVVAAGYWEGIRLNVALNWCFVMG
jgi:hypothetical protein